MYHYDNLIFKEAAGTSNVKAQTMKRVEAKIPGQTRFGDYLIEAAVFDEGVGRAGRFKAGKTSFVEWFDYEKLSPPLVVRFRQAGERFVPLGAKEETKVGRFLIGQRVPQRIRRKTLIVADADKIVWVWPIRISEQVRITDGTRKILRLQITDASHSGPDEETKKE